MVRQLIPLSLAATLLVAASADAQNPERARTTVRQGPFGAVVAYGDGNRLVLGLSTSSGGMRDTLGLLISSITPDSPAEKAGLEEGNRITAINGVSLRLIPSDASDPEMAGVLGRRFQRELDKMKPGEAVTLRVFANGQNREVKVTPVRADELPSMRGGLRNRADERPTIGASLGGFASPRDTLGVFVVSVAEDGPLAKAGVFEGSRIASINGVDLRVPAADVGDEYMTSSRVRRLTREVEKLEPGANAELRVYSNGQYRNVTVKTVKRSELKQNTGVSIFQSGGGSGVFFSPMPDLSRFRFDMNHDLSNETRERIEEMLRGSEIQLRSLQERLRDQGGEWRLRNDDTRQKLEEMLRAVPERIRISGDSAWDDAARRDLEQILKRMQQSATPFRTTVSTDADRAMTGSFMMSFDASPAVVAQSGQPPVGGQGFKSQGVQAGAQGAQAAQARQTGRRGPAGYTSSGDPSINGAVFMVSGIRFSPINAQLASYLGAGSERGLLVVEIDDTWSGLLAGDVVLSIDGRAVRERDNTHVYIDDSKEQIAVEILRSGEAIKGNIRRR
jgi:S1-C subfamily serine protease